MIYEVQRLISFLMSVKEILRDLQLDNTFQLIVSILSVLGSLFGWALMQKNLCASILGGLHGYLKRQQNRLYIFFFYLCFLSRTFTILRTAGEGNGSLFNSSLPLPTASQTLRYQPGGYCRELTSTHSQQPDSNREPLVSERKSLTTKLRTLK